MKTKFTYLLLLFLIALMPSKALAAEAYCVLDDGTLTFYYDDSKSSRTGTKYAIASSYSYPSIPDWSDNDNITKVVFNSSFASYHPTNTACWFLGLSKLESITGISYLKTSNVTDMNNMFEGCSSLTSLDVSNFNTSNVTDMGHMFSGCSSLTSLDLSSFNTSNVTYMFRMFYGCSNLTSLDLSSFNTSKVTDMWAMFCGCPSLTSLNLSNFNTSKVTDMGYMFADCSGLTSLNLSSFDMSEVTYTREMFRLCSSLKTIYSNSNWNTSTNTESTDMFSDCTSLVGGKGTKYDENHVDKTYACPDGGTSSPGYFTLKEGSPDASYDYYVVIWLNDGTKTEYRYDENFVIRIEGGRIIITTKTGTVDFAYENIKELTLIKRGDDGAIVPISSGEKEKMGIVVYMRDGTLRWIPIDGIKSIVSYNEVSNDGNDHMQSLYRGHGFVNLGLSTNWASCNIGADVPEGKGSYFSWGETKTKDIYNEETYKFGYPPSKYTDEDGMTQLISTDDAAQVNWGGLWRMPTRADEEELYEKCDWEWTTVNGVDGFKVTGPNGNSIFLPATGLYDGDSTNKLKRSDTGGWYWSSTTNGSYYACGICFPSPNYLYKNVPNHERWDGHAIRPVLDSTELEESFGIIIYLKDGSELKIAQRELDRIEIYHLPLNTEGDVNGDRAIDVADIASIITVMAGDAYSLLAINADVNGDGAVDVADIATIISIMAGDKPNITAPAAPDPLPRDPNLTFPNPKFVLEYDSEKGYVLVIYISGLRHPYTLEWLDLYGSKDDKNNTWVDIDSDPMWVNVDDEGGEEQTKPVDVTFLIDNSGSMSEEADLVASEILNWAQKRSNAGLDIRFGCVGFSEYGQINGALSFGTAEQLSSYLNEGNRKGTSRTMHFGTSDNNLANAANGYKVSAECGGMALRYADDNMDFRTDAMRHYIIFTDEPNQPNGNKNYSLKWFEDKNNWPTDKGVIHTIYSDNNTFAETIYYKENYNRLKNDTGGQYQVTDGYLTGLNMEALDVSTALDKTRKISVDVPGNIVDGKEHKVRITYVSADHTAVGQTTYSVKLPGSTGFKIRAK